MTERQTTSTSTAERDQAVTPDDGVEVFDTNAANPTPGRRNIENNVGTGSTNSGGYIGSEQSTSQRTDLDAGMRSDGQQGTNLNNILIAVAVIIVIVLLLYWIF